MERLEIDQLRAQLAESIAERQQAEDHVATLSAQ